MGRYGEIWGDMGRYRVLKHRSQISEVTEKTLAPNPHPHPHPHLNLNPDSNPNPNPNPNEVTEKTLALFSDLAGG